MDSQTCMICVGLLIIIVVTIILLSRTSGECFEHVGQPVDAANLPDGTYRITNVDGLSLRSDLVDTVQCKDFLIGVQPGPNAFDGWQLQRVSSSVYKLLKPSGKECLYASPANQLRSFYFPSCDGANLCGLSKPDYKGELDGDSLRSYFMILQHPNGKFYLKNMRNNMYVTMTSNKLKMTRQPTTQSLFTITSY